MDQSLAQLQELSKRFDELTKLRDELYKRSQHLAEMKKDGYAESTIKTTGKRLRMMKRHGPSSRLRIAASRSLDGLTPSEQVGMTFGR